MYLLIKVTSRKLERALEVKQFYLGYHSGSRSPERRDDLPEVSSSFVKYEKMAFDSQFKLFSGEAMLPSNSEKLVRNITIP